MERQTGRETWLLTRFLTIPHKQMILTIPITLNGEVSQPHPFMPYVEACFKDLHLLQVESIYDLFPGHEGLKKLPADPFLDTPDYWTIDSPELLGHREKPESFSSLEKLVNYPYQWVLNYKASLSPGFHGQLQHDAIMRGNLAHRIFQGMLTPEIIMHDKKTLRMEFSKIVDEELDKQGWYFMQRGYETTLTFFRFRLFDHYCTLINHLITGNWIPVQCEYPADGVLGEEPVKGYLDLLLERTKNGTTENVIVDLKWGGYKQHSAEMSENRDFQLAVYSKLMNRNSQFIPTAFFILSRGILLTRSHDAFPHGILCGKDNLQQDYSTLVASIETSIKFRRNELKKGKIEVGIDTKASELEIYQDEHCFHPDSEGKRDKKKKSLPKYDDYTTFTASR